MLAQSTTAHSTPSQSIRAKLMPMVRAAAGNALEMYDFQIFGYYAAAIAVTFFPSGSEFAALMFSFSTFGAGFLMRPLGAIVLGAYIDHRGRRAGLLLTLALMGFGTLAIACLPGYAILGLAAPLLVLAGRLVQGFSAGVELGGVSVYLSEIAPPKRKGLYVSWQSASQMSRWGWRIALLAGCSLLPLLLFLRRSLQETGEFLARPTAPPHPKSRKPWPRIGAWCCSGSCSPP
jgi:MFS family permease